MNGHFFFKASKQPHSFYIQELSKNVGRKIVETTNGNIFGLCRTGAWIVASGLRNTTHASPGDPDLQDHDPIAHGVGLAANQANRILTLGLADHVIVNSLAFLNRSQLWARGLSGSPIMIRVDRDGTGRITQLSFNLRRGTIYGTITLEYSYPYGPRPVWLPGIIVEQYKEIRDNSKCYVPRWTNLIRRCDIGTVDLPNEGYVSQMWLRPIPGEVTIMYSNGVGFAVQGTNISKILGLTELLVWRRDLKWARWSLLLFFTLTTFACFRLCLRKHRSPQKHNTHN